MFFSIARFVTPTLLAILSAVIDGSEITRSIIFCAVLLTFLGVSDVSPNLSAFTPNLSPNFLRLQGTFREYYLPCWPLLSENALLLQWRVAVFQYRGGCKGKLAI